MADRKPPGERRHAVAISMTDAESDLLDQIVERSRCGSRSEAVRKMLLSAAAELGIEGWETPGEHT